MVCRQRSGRPARRLSASSRAWSTSASVTSWVPGPPTDVVLPPGGTVLVPGWSPKPPHQPGSSWIVHLRERKRASAADAEPDRLPPADLGAVQGQPGVVPPEQDTAEQSEWYHEARPRAPVSCLWSRLCCECSGVAAASSGSDSGGCAAERSSCLRSTKPASVSSLILKVTVPIETWMPSAVCQIRAWCHLPLPRWSQGVVHLGALTGWHAQRHRSSP
jgi:hypothetical protein